MPQRAQPLLLVATGGLCPAEHSNGTASDELEEGGDDVKSVWPLCLGPHTCYNGVYNAQQTREGKLIAKNAPQFGLQAAIRLHEAGIASNGGSANRREYVPWPCTHRPSSDGSRRHPKMVHQPAREEAVEGEAGDWR